MVQTQISCIDCYYISGDLIDLCQFCQNQLIQQDQETNQQFIDNKSERIQANTKAIIRKERNQSKKLKRKIKNSEFQMAKEQLIKLSQKQCQQQKILQDIIQKSEKKGLSKYSKKFGQGTSFRGPKSQNLIKNLCKYQKPNGFHGFAISAPQGQYLSSNGNDDQWLVAYHGTSLHAIQKIIKEGFIPGTGQAHANHLNINPLCENPNQRIGHGIYCTPSINVATTYNKSNRYITILQCRVNPYQVKVSQNNSDIWVLADTYNIIPYRLLVKKR